MGDKYGLIRQHSELWRSLRDGDFEEEEIWDVVKEKSDVHIHNETSFPISMPKSLTSASRMIPRRNNNNNNSSISSANSSQEIKALQQSAPVNIPNWSEIYRNNKQRKIPKNIPRYNNNDYDFDFYHSVNDEGDDDVVNNGDSENENDEEENDDDEYDTKLPPHEIIARRLARSQISSFSVFEGVGRTLKGRDLSKMRNAILTKTGFLESL